LCAALVLGREEMGMIEENQQNFVKSGVPPAVEILYKPPSVYTICC
jgi:hypothetical protein